MTQWQNSSAYFNGNAVDVALHVAPHDQGVSIAVDSLLVGDPNSPAGIQDQCGPTDDRVASDNPRVGRLLDRGCTAWLIATGVLVTAGHCLTPARLVNVLEFNVPLSASDGTIKHPGPNDQYAVNISSIRYRDNGIGDDFGAFQVSPNPNTGLLPLAAQGASFQVVQNLGPSTIRITGYGTDDGTANQTQQSATGPNAGSSGTVMRYQTDSEGGNSGGPIIDEATGNAVGVHTNGECALDGSNKGTSTFNTAFWAMLSVAAFTGTVKNDFVGGEFYVDNDRYTNVPLAGQSFVWLQNTQHTLSAVDNQTPLDGYKRHFWEWRKDGGFFASTPQTTTDAVTSNVSYEARFRREFSITISAAYVEPTGGGTYNITRTSPPVNLTGQTSWSGTSIENLDAAITLQAVPGTGAFFAGWSDGTAANPYTFTPSDHKTLYAIYKMPLKASSATATSLSNQRKVVRFGSTTHAVYQSGGRIWYTQNDDWNPGWTLEKAMSISGVATNPSIATTYPAGQTNVHIVWEDNYQGVLTTHRGVFYQRSTDNGATWLSSPIVLIDGGELYRPWGTASATPVVAGLTTYPVVLWQWGNGSTAGGLVMAPDPAAGLQFYEVTGTNATTKIPSLQAGQGPFRLATVHNGGKIYYTEFGCGGAPSYTPSFGALTDISTAFSGLTNCSNPTIADYSGANTFVAWEADNGSAHRVYAREKTGAGWQLVKEFTHLTHNESKPTIGIDGGGQKVSVLWECGTHIARDTRAISTSLWNNIADLGQGYSPSLADFVQGGNVPTVAWTSGTAAPYAITLYKYAPPPASSLISPADASTNISSSPTLTWSSTFDAETYHLQVSSASDFSTLEVDETDLSVTNYLVGFDVLNFSTSYYWQVQAQNSTGGGTWSPPWSFTTSAASPAPTLSWTTVLVNNVRRPKLTWTVPPGITSPYKVYRYQCACGEGDCGGVGSLRTTTNDTTYTDLGVVVQGKLDQCLSTSFFYVKGTISGTSTLTGPSNKVLVNNTNIAWKPGSVEVVPELPVETRLTNNYPNPFNPTTTLAYQLTSPGRVSIIVYNILGEEIASLVEADRNAGYYQTVWDASKHGSGLYYARIIVSDLSGTESYRETRKLLLMK
ncbi:MAG TPA: trypsin-like peptidase domain-containing protein [Bacteroidota bacterium]|nr:trypsin-like peptidase domain-containing protein [Bacteroidota bacterium]